VQHGDNTQSSDFENKLTNGVIEPVWKRGVETMNKPDAEIITRNLSCWSGAIALTRLDGGISNENFLVTNDGRNFVVRVNGDVPVHGVTRLNDYNCNRAAAAVGVAPAVYHYEPGAIVVEYIQGRTLADNDVREDRILGQIVDLIKRTHRDAFRVARGPIAAFWPFRVCRDYAFFMEENGSGWNREVPRLRQLNDNLEQSIGATDIVLGHNDLLAANLLDDGDRLWLIDWEHAGFGSPLFDLANLATNNNLSEAQERNILELYFEGPPDDETIRRFGAMKCASLLREAMWSMVSETQSSLDFDYAGYTEEYLSRLKLAVEIWESS